MLGGDVPAIKSDVRGGWTRVTRGICQVSKFTLAVALRNSETTSWSKVEGVGFHKRPGKWPK